MAYKGVILAAGHGSRMGPFGERLPKPIAPICNRPLMAYQLDELRRLGITDVIVVIGHLGHRIAQTIGDGGAFGVRVEYVEQEQRLGLAHAVGQLERHLAEPFVLMLGDIFFRTRDLESMLRSFELDGASAVLAVKEEPDEAAIKRNFSVLLRDDGTVRRVVEKPRHVTNRLKGCGLYLFDTPIFDAIRRTPRTAMRDEYELTDSIQILIDLEYAVRVAKVVEWDVNLTYVRDLIACCELELRQQGVETLVHPKAQVHSEATLSWTVVGEGARIEGAATLDRCVVLPGARVQGPDLHSGVVFTPEGPLQT